MPGGYVYWRSEPGLWTVGFLAPGGVGPNRDRHPESDHDSEAGAATRVAELNGGRVTNTGPGPSASHPANRLEPADCLHDILGQLERLVPVVERIAETLDKLAES